MLPQTHRFIINEAITHCGSWAREFQQEILRGSDDEDVLIMPLVGWRLRAAGFTHTHVPNGHYGELGFPSAKKRAKTFLAAAKKNSGSSCAWWLGRTCHLLGDTAVPARARRIWHLEGDPLEAWIETHLLEVTNLPRDENPRILDPDDLFEQMARFAAAFPADTTRTPWGRAAFRWFGAGEQLEKDELERQARLLIPKAISMTQALIAWMER